MNVDPQWQTKKLKEIFTIQRGGSPRPIESYLTNDPKGINWIKIGDTKTVLNTFGLQRRKLNLKE